MEPRSSRLKDKKKGAGDILVKDLFVHDVLQNNSLFHTIGKGSSVIVLPQMRSGSTLPGDSQLKMKARLFPSLGSPDLVVKTRKGSESRNMDAGRDGDPQSDRVSNQGLFSCVTCGILCFSSVAVIQPTEMASQYLVSGDCSRFSDCVGAEGLVASDENSNALESNSSGGLFDIPIQGTDQNQPVDVNNPGVSKIGLQKGTSSLGLLAMTYGDCSDSEGDDCETDVAVRDSERSTSNIISEGSGGWENAGHSYNRSECGEKKSSDCCLEVKISSPLADSNCGRAVFMSEATRSTSLMHSESKIEQVDPSRDEDSSRMHIFCLQHAVQAEKQLRAIGGAHVILLCHPDYPMLEAEAKQVADELGNADYWNDVSYREASLEDEEIIQSALDSEEAIHGNCDWAVKLGINLYYTANLSRSPLYSKQLPYNSMIYSAFGLKNQETTSNREKFSGRHRKVIVAGKWCGKVWTASQVHPMLTEGQSEEQDHMRNIPTFKKPTLKIERSSEGQKTVTPRKSCRKRKAAAVASEAVNAGTPETDDCPHEAFESLEADDGLDEFFECPRISVKRPKISSRNMQMRKETFEPHINDKETDSHTEDEHEGGPSTRLRKRTAKPSNESGRKATATAKTRNRSGKMVEATAKSCNGSGRETETKPAPKTQPKGRFAKKGPAIKEAVHSKNSKMRVEGEYQCDIENCTMSFVSKQELVLHKKNICPVKGCGKNFFSHKYLVQHRRVHVDDRPLKCPWKGCNMTFKWAWARTEHIRVHTGERPYVCTESGCSQTFRFVSDFSRHKRKTGHSTKKVKK